MCLLPDDQWGLITPITLMEKLRLEASKLGSQWLNSVSPVLKTTCFAISWSGLSITLFLYPESILFVFSSALISASRVLCNLHICVCSCIPILQRQKQPKKKKWSKRELTCKQHNLSSPSPALNSTGSQAFSKQVPLSEFASHKTISWLPEGTLLFQKQVRHVRLLLPWSLIKFDSSNWKAAKRPLHWEKLCFKASLKTNMLRKCKPGTRLTYLKEQIFKELW